MRNKNKGNSRTDRLRSAFSKEDPLENPDESTVSADTRPDSESGIPVDNDPGMVFALARQNDFFSRLNRFSMELSLLSLEDNLEAFIAKGAKEIAGAEAVVFAEYDPASRTTRTRHIEMAPGRLEKVVRLLGKQVTKVHSLVSDEVYREMTTQTIGMRRTLHEASFGAVSRTVGAAIQALLNVDRFIGVAYLIEGKLYGTSLLALRKGTPDPPVDVLKNFAFLAAVSLRRKLAEEALHETRWRLERIIEGTHTGTWEWNVQTGATIFNAVWAQIVGYTLDELAPVSIKTWETLVHPDDLKQSTELLERHFAGELPTYDCDCRMKHKDGHLVWVHDRGSVITRTDDGKPLMMFGTHTEITERKRAEDDLRQSAKRVRELAELLPETIFETDMQGALTFANKNAFDRFGYTPEDFAKGLNLIDMVAPEDRGRASESAGRIINGESIGSNEYTMRRKDGSTFLSMIHSTAIFQDGKPLGLRGFVIDISGRKRAEEEKAKLEGQLQQAQKMESVGRLAGGVAHDFNNMLGVILGHTEVALEQVDPAQPLHADLIEIRTAAERSANLTRQLLAFARKQTVAPKVLDLNETVHGMLKMLERLIGEDVHLTWQPEADLWPILVDPSQIDQILANLCLNARDAIKDVGKITIETGNSAFDEAYCADHPGFVPGEYVLLAVSDDGCGMDKETLSHLFEPFFTTKGMGKGTGLGLATVYGIVKQNNGFISVYSEQGQGTTIKNYLPRHVGKAEQARMQGVPGPAQRGRETILLVEDEPANLKLITTMLERQGYTVLAASTPGEAIHRAREHAGEIHLLMTDVVMPEMNGRELARSLLSFYPHLERLFMSGYPANVIAHHGVLDEGVHFIQKPFSRKDLAAKVREALESE